MRLPEPSPRAPDYAATYRRTRERTTAMLAGRPAADAAVVVPACPAWTVKDLASHLAGVPAALLARQLPGADQQAWVDGHVADRAGRSLDDVLAEWSDVGPAFEDLIARKGIFTGLVYDVVAHEHDLRAALGVDGERDLDAVRVSMFLAAELLAADLARHDLPAIELVTDRETWSIGEGEPGLRLHSDLFEAFRLLGSRRSHAQLVAAPWDGDVERFLPALAHMELPAGDLHG